MKNHCNTRGFSHHFILPVLAIIAVGAIGLLTLRMSGATAAPCKKNSVLRNGSSGTCVQYAELMLNATSGTGDNVKVDKDFTSATKEKTKRFQKKKSLQVDGIIGPKTWSKLCSQKYSGSALNAQAKACGTTASLAKSLSVTTNESDKLGYKKIAAVKNCGIMQGGTTDGKYFYFACAKSDVSKVRIVKYSLSGDKIAESENYERAKVGHANAMAYNKKLNKLVLTVADTKGEKGSNGITDQVRFINPSTLKLEGVNKKMSDGKTISSLCYRDGADQYVANGRLYDSNFNFLKKVFSNGTLDKQLGLDQEAKVKYDNKQTRILYQGIACDTSYIYTMRVVFRQNGYNILSVYDWAGNTVGTYKINLNDEGENLAVINGIVYMGINEGTMSSGGNSNNDYIIKLDPLPLNSPSTL